MLQLTQNFKLDAILAIARGGLSIGQLMAYALDKRELFTLNSIHYNKENKLDTIEIFNIPNLSHLKRVLIVDDIVDSGETMQAILEKLKKLYPNIEFKLATIFYKKGSLVKADFALKEANEWIDFFWEVDAVEKISNSI